MDAPRGVGGLFFMKHAHSPTGALFALFLLHGLLHAGTTQDPSTFEERRDASVWMPSDGAESRQTIFEGRVVTPEGSPAQGAVVVTSAGGKAVTDEKGSFRLAVELPRDVLELNVTAVQNGGTAGLVGSAEVPVLQLGGTNIAGTLRLGLGSGCDPSWLPTFGCQPGMPQPSARVFALAVFDDGSGDGPALYAGGYFWYAGGVAASCIAKWDGSTWASLGLGTNYSVYALAVFDDGSGRGPALYAGGDFTTAGGQPANHIARWNGSSWSPLGSGVSDYAVYSLTVYDDGSGSGPALYAGGNFNTAGSVAANCIAKWDGTSWAPVGGGMAGSNASINSLTVHDDGSGNGMELFAGGLFTTAGDVAAANIAKWDGSSWGPLGSGITGKVLALTAYDDGSGAGSALYAGGYFTAAGGVAANRIAKWDGSIWTPLGSGMNDVVLALGVFDDGSGSGPALYAGGDFTTAGGVAANRIAKWDGSSWNPLGSGMNDSVRALAVQDDGTSIGSALYAGGNFDTAGGVPTKRIANWDGSSWRPLGRGMDSFVWAFAVLDDGTGDGQALYAGGGFVGAGGVVFNHVAKWDGTMWSPLGSGMDDLVLALAAYDDGSGNGPALYAGGEFTTAGGIAAKSIAKWDGSSWQAVGGGMKGGVFALTVFDDGTGGGPALYAGGEFTTAGGQTANRIAKWDGTAWCSLGTGMNEEVRALAVYEVAGREALYAGGKFTTAGGVPAYCIAKWNGTSWADVGIGTGNEVWSFAVHDDGTGSGPELYAGGRFLYAGGMYTPHIAKWNGTTWAAVGSGMNNDVFALAVHDDRTGGGPALYAGGWFTIAGGVSANRIAKWDGSSWSPLGSGLGGGAYAMAAFDDGLGGGSALHVGGSFFSSPAGDSYMAKWGCPADVGVAYCFCDGSGAPAPCGNAGGPGEGCANSTGMGAVLAADGSTSVGADDISFQATNLLPNQPATLFAGHNAVNNGDGIPFGDGLRCAGGSLERLGVEVPDANGAADWGPGLAATGGWAAGDTRRFQVWYRNPTGSPCMTNFNLSNGYEIVFTQ